MNTGNREDSFEASFRAELVHDRLVSCEKSQTLKTGQMQLRIFLFMEDSHKMRNQFLKHIAVKNDNY